MKKIIVFVIFAFILLTNTQANPLITAINYDPQGSDGGYEWIELFNPTNQTINLANYSIEKGNGANENDWTLIWSNTSYNLSPYSFYLIGEGDVLRADEILKLSLQNGPDAIRINRTNTTLEVIGWGEHEFNEYYEHNPTLDKASIPIVRNYSITNTQVAFKQSGDNSQDFVPLLPYEPRNSVTSITQLLLPTNAEQDLTYVFMVENTVPQMFGINLRNADVMTAQGHQIAPDKSDVLLLSANISDGNGQADIIGFEYELRFFGEVYGTGLVDNFEIDNGTFLFSIPFAQSHPVGTYDVGVRAIDSQDASSQQGFSEFEIHSVLGVEVNTSVLLFTQFEDTSTYVANFTLTNTGNLEVRSEFMFFGLDESIVTYSVDEDEITLPLFLNVGEAVNITVRMTMQQKMSAGRYTGTFRVMAYE